MGARSEREQIIAFALGAPMPERTAATFGEWRLLGGNGADISVCARMVDQWFELTASKTGRVPLTLSQTWSTLRCNLGLNGAVRVALAPGAVEPHLRGEICASEVDLHSRIGALCDDTRVAFQALHDRSHIDRSGPDARPTAAAKPSRDAHRLVQLCAESGWPYVERASGQVEVPIECGPTVYQAQLELTEDGALCAVTELVDVPALTSAARAAVALLLLNTSAIVRSVKGVVVQRDGIERAGLAAACERPRSGADLDRALTALAVACGTAGREATALRHETLARDYLAWHAPALVDPRETFESNQSDNNNRYVLEETPCLQQL